MTLAVDRGDTGGRTYWFNNPKLRAVVFQGVLLLIVLIIILTGAWNAVENLAKQGRTLGFEFLGRTASFDIGQTPIEYTSLSSNGRALLVGIVNTLIVAALGIVLATLLGFLIGVARLSTNWVVAKLATVYIEVVRNIPLLLQLLFWYGAVLKPLPGVRQSITFGDNIYLNNRGIFFPSAHPEAGAWVVGVALIVGILGAVGFTSFGKRQQMATGKRPPVLLVNLALIIGLPLVAFFAAGVPFTMDYPKIGGFNVSGGFHLQPEFVALLLGLTIYTAAFIAETVRSGIRGVPHGQTEASGALGLRSGQNLRLVVIPQAMRIIVPPLASQYLNLTKNSSLAVAIGYPDLVQVFSGTVLNNTNQAIECIGITMAVYLIISLSIAGFMNWFNKRVALVER
ncbi:amino acid ABC transporter permease [Labrys neptuniae]